MADHSINAPRLICRLLLLAALFASSFQDPSQSSKNKEEYSREEKQQIKLIAAEAFRQMYDGWSSDEVILQDELNKSFVNQCKQTARGKGRIADVSPGDWNWALINLRKAGKLKTKTTQRKTIDLSGVRHVAEIVSRSLIDKHACSIDRLMCDQELRKEFDESAKAIAASIDLYATRKAAFQLRKARRLKPELIGRITDWGRKIETLSINEIRANPDQVNEHPGVYIFRDSTGYLYIGQTGNLRKRLKEHLDESHNLSLAAYLKKESDTTISIEIHDFDPESQASKTMVRRAYESELIASRKPKFNVQP